MKAAAPPARTPPAAAPCRLHPTPRVPSPPGAGRRRRRVFAALAVLGTSTLLAALAEAALRVRERAYLRSESPSTWAGDYQVYQRLSHQADRMFVRDPADPIIAYRNRPDLALEFPLPSGRTWSARINSQGFRGAEFPREKPAGAFRIICLGGSTTFWGYSDRETYPALLEERLRAKAPGRGLEVLNLGVSGYTSRMSAERLRREYRALAPDLVVVLHGVNDITVLAPQRYRHRVARSLLLATAANAAGEALGGEGAELKNVIARRFDSAIAPNYDLIRSEAEAMGAKLLVLSFPGPQPSLLGEGGRTFLEAELYRSWRELGSLDAYLAALEVYNEKLRAWARRAGVPLGDLARRVRGGTDLYMDICHMNTAGLSLVAQEVARAVLGQGWLTAGE